MQAILKVTGVFPKNSKECIETYNIIKEKVIKTGIIKPKILISITTGIAYVFEMKEKLLPEGNNVA